MKHIFICEWIRYKKLTAVLALLYLLCLVFLNAKIPLYRMSELAFILLIIIPSLFAVVIGVIQFIHYKKMSHWTYLIHRPISLFNIFIGMVLTFITMLFVIVLVPVSVYLLILDINNPLLIEPRHYLIVLYTFLTTMSFYFACVFATLHPKKLAYCAVLLPFAVLAAEIKGIEQFVPMGIMMLVLFLLAWSTFKVNLQINLRKPLSALSSNILLQYSIFAVLSFIVFEIGHLGISLTNNNLSSEATTNYYTNTYVMDDKERMLWNIHGDQHEELSALKNEIALATFSSFSTGHLSRLPKPYKNQPIMDDRGISFYDKTRQVRWNFSHQNMLFVGMDKNNNFSGWLGVNGRSESLASAVPFNSVPLINKGYVILAKTLAQFNEVTETFDSKLNINSEQRIEYSPLVGSNFVAVILTNEIQIFLKRQFFNSTQIIEPIAIVPITESIDDLKQITFAELYDGHLVSIIYGTTKYGVFDRGAADIKNGYVATYKTLYEGEVVKVTERQLSQGWPDWMYYRDFMISNLYASIKFGLIKDIPVKLPLIFLYISIAITFAVALFAFVLMRRSTKSLLEKTCWVVGSALAGIPGAIACWMLSDWQPEGNDTQTKS
ncbi:hypothetical protein [Thalassotalea ganghwensis]